MAAQLNTSTTSKAKASATKSKPSTMNLKEFIRQQWESDQHAADDLGVSLRTIKNWMALNPTGILKHSTQIVAMQKVEPLQLFDAVAETIEQINEKRKR